MQTVTQLNRLWTRGQYRRLIRTVLAGRPEGRLGLDVWPGGRDLAAALTLMRLGELNAGSSRLAAELGRSLVWGQRRDGAWGSASACEGAVATTTAAAAAGLATCEPASSSAALTWLRERQGVYGWRGRPLTTPAVLMLAARVGGSDLRVADALRQEAQDAGEGRVEADAVTRQAWEYARLRCGRLVGVLVPHRLPAAEATNGLFSSAA